MKNLKIGVKIAGGFGAVLFLALIMSLMVLLGNISIQNAVTNSGFASELQIAGMEVLSAYSVLKDDVATLEMSDDDAAYARAVEHLKQCNMDIAAMQELSQSNKALNHFHPLLDTLSTSFDAWGKSIDELQSSNKRLEEIVTETYKSGEMLSNRSRIVFDKQMEELAVEAGQELTALQRMDRIKYIRDGQKISDDIANGRRKLEIILTTYDMDAFDEALRNLKTTLMLIRDYSSTAKSEEDRAATQSLETRVLEYCDYVVNYSREIELAQACIAEEKGYSENVLRDLNTLLAELDAESTYQAGVTLEASRISLIIVMTSAALALLFGILIAAFIVRSVTKPIGEMVEAAGRIAEGDVDIDLNVDSNDEIGTLARAFKNMIEGIRQQVRYMEKLSAGDMSFKVAVRSDKDVMNLGFQKLCENMSDVFVRLKGTAALVADTASDIAYGSQALADGTSQQADNIRELSGSLEDISKQTKENSGLAVKASELGDKIKADAERGSVQMDNMVSAVAEITQASRSISSVMKIIDDIAFQTNILALNAAVEAARAGQQGKGFAVVAEEVRNLASKSAEAASNTGAMIENSIKKAELGATIATDTSESLKKIVEGIIESSNIVGTIAKSSEVQSESMERINESIGNVSDVIHTNTATSEQSAAAADTMKNQSQELNRLISEFRLAEGK